MEYIFINRNTEVLDFIYDEEIHNIDKITTLINSKYAPLGIIDEKKKLFYNWWKIALFHHVVKLGIFLML